MKITSPHRTTKEYFVNNVVHLSDYVTWHYELLKLFENDVELEFLQQKRAERMFLERR